MFTVIITCMILMLFGYALFNTSKLTTAIANIIGILTPIITGCVIAYILCPFLNFLEDRWLYPMYKDKGYDLTLPENRKKKKNVRKLSVLITIVFFILLLYLVLMMLIPQIFNSITEIVRYFPLYISNLQSFIDTYLNDNPQVRSMVDSLILNYSSTMSDIFGTKIMPNISTVLQTVSKSISGVVQVIFYLIVGIIVAIYLLNSKELFAGQVKKLCYAIFKKETANEILSAFRYAHHTFMGFVIGKLIDSLIIGVITYIFCLILSIPYPVLLAFVVGITNIIPFFGPYIGGFMGAILLIMINPIKALVFIILIVIIQQFDGNILGPLILGNSTGLSSFWVIFSIMLFGGLLGPVGWIIGVPTFACIYAFVRYETAKKLVAKQMPPDTQSYIDLAYMDEKGITNIKDADDSKYYVHNEGSSWKRIFKFYKKSKKVLDNVVPVIQNDKSASEDDDKKNQEKSPDDVDNNGS